jgi:hypothetical protein
MPKPERIITWLRSAWLKYTPGTNLVQAKANRYHEAELLEGNGDPMREWRAVRHGFKKCPICENVKKRHYHDINLLDNTR